MNKIFLKSPFPYLKEFGFNYEVFDFKVTVQAFQEDYQRENFIWTSYFEYHIVSNDKKLFKDHSSVTEPLGAEFKVSFFSYMHYLRESENGLKGTCCFSDEVIPRKERCLEAVLFELDKALKTVEFPKELSSDEFQNLYRTLELTENVYLAYVNNETLNAFFKNVFDYVKTQENVFKTWLKNDESLEYFYLSAAYNKLTLNHVFGSLEIFKRYSFLEELINDNKTFQEIKDSNVDSLIFESFSEIFKELTSLKSYMVFKAPTHVPFGSKITVLFNKFKVTNSLALIPSGLFYVKDLSKYVFTSEILSSDDFDEKVFSKSVVETAFLLFEDAFAKDEDRSLDDCLRLAVDL